MLAYARGNWAKDSMTGNYPWQEWATVINSNALLFTLEADRQERRKYVDQVEKMIGLWPQYQERLGQGHQGSVDAASVLFNQLLALDVMHPDLSPERVKAWEDALAKPFAWFEADRLPNGDHFHWELARFGLLAVWHVYHGDTLAARRAADDYHHALTQWSMTPDGSWVQSTGYAHARMGGNRTAKSNALDVLHFNGYHDYYNDPQFHAFWRWFNAFAMAPNRHIPRMGETGLFRERPGWVPAFYYLDKYNPEVAAQGAWNGRAAPAGPEPRWLNNLISFVLMPAEAPEPRMPTSLLMPNSGAALWGREGESEAMQGILYSLKRENYETGGFHHAMEDVNSLSLSGYGEFLLMNAGTNYKPSYPGMTPDGDRWYEAHLQNVVLVGDTSRHALVGEGGGLKDGLTGGSIEFGATSSGEALGSDNVHTRALFLVHPTESENGYYLLHDEVKQPGAQETVHVLWQPNTRAGTETVLAPNQSYRTPTNGYQTAATDSTEAAVFFFATPPLRVGQTSAWKGSFDLGNFANTKLVADYAPGQAALTAILPSDAAHPAPLATRISGANYTGALITHPSGRVDYALETHGGPATYQDVTTDAKTIIGTGRTLALYHVREFHNGAGYGFTANQPISLVMDGPDGGYVSSRGGDVAFSGPFSAILIDGQPARPGGKRAATPLTISVPPGRHTLQFVRK